MKFFEEAALRLKQQLRVSDDAQAAQAIGMSPRAWAGRKKNDSFPEKELRALAQQRPELGIDVEYVLHGRASPMAFGTVGQVGARLRAERLRINWSDAEMARHLGCPLADYLALEEGRRALTAAEVMALRNHDELDADLVLVGVSVQRPGVELSADEQELLQLFRAASLSAKAAAIGALGVAAVNSPRRRGKAVASTQHATSGGVNVSGSVGGDVLGGGAIKAGGDVTAPGGVSAKVSRSFFGVAIGSNRKKE